MRRGRRKQGGFTLLEVMIAMAILVLALTALLGHEGVAIQMSDFSNKLSQATLLAQGKLLDLEHKLLDDAMDSLDNCEDGDFRDEGFDKFKWKACGYKLELPEDAAEAMTERFMALLGGFGLDPTAAAAADATGQLAFAISAIPTFLQQLEDKIRKVRLEVTWGDLVGERAIVMERYITILGTDPADAPPPPDGAAPL